eukprot:CAMPEP_0206331094 /NCGR_PEP_ID=MMETSP0106_2-20121207/24066_1 /ASSEMBLY_ACC=CAM_ASM_000206 /TAXON_ID=81532 /ORGANISM="Acanthoeca-like sp., Strain 10tr" /LENGTH=158 /DNA_ID=CAMNT_0053763891 /DNA_START=473 /DNA_END=949 /DNA_ORIENTATION=-
MDNFFPLETRGAPRFACVCLKGVARNLDRLGLSGWGAAERARLPHRHHAITASLAQQMPTWERNILVCFIANLAQLEAFAVDYGSVGVIRTRWAVHNLATCAKRLFQAAVRVAHRGAARDLTRRDATDFAPQRSGGPQRHCTLLVDSRQRKCGRTGIV